MYKYSIYLKFKNQYETTEGIDIYLNGNTKEEVAKTAKELYKDRNILYIEVANTEISEGITFFNGQTLEIYQEL